MISYNEIYNRIVEFAKTDNRIGAMVLFGSRARKDHPADCYSDYDILFFADDIPSFTENDQWLEGISDVFISFVEKTAANGIERRVFFDHAMDMDFLFYPVSEAERVLKDPAIISWYAKGFKIVVDKINYTKLVEANKPFTRTVHTISQKEFDTLVQTFYFHAIWSAKKLLRGEIWSAKQCIDGYMKTLLREVLESSIIAEHASKFDVWHDGRFFDEWASPQIISALNGAYGGYDKESLFTALKNTIKLFSEEAGKLARMLEYEYPVKAERYSLEQVLKLINR